jgi:hypothetical protein
MDGRSEFFVFMGAAIGTAVTLFVAQQVYASYIDVNVVHGNWADAPRDAKIVAMREAESKALSGGKLPIQQAIEQLAQRGRGASNKIAPMQSEDVSAMSGWAFKHGFAAYTPRKAAPPPAPDTALPSEAGVPGSAATPAAPQPTTVAPGAAVPSEARAVPSGTVQVDSNAPSTAAHATH